MRTRFVILSLAVVLIVFAVRDSLMPASRAFATEKAPVAPAFTHGSAKDWINSSPLTWADLKGHVVLLDFWTYACVNCYRSIPWLHEVESRYGARGLRIVGVHTPELPYEYLRGNVQKKITEYKLTNPIMLDNDHSYWEAIGNQYWPAFYLVDKQGRVRAVFVGETHSGENKARDIEDTIEKLLAEPAG